MGFRVPLPERCRGCGKREAGSGRAGSAGETIAFGGFDDAAGGRHGGDALVEGGGANHAQGNLRSLMIMADELLAAAAERQAERIDEALLFEACALAPQPKAAAGKRR
jgi:hypothetical protein